MLKKLKDTKKVVEKFGGNVYLFYFCSVLFKWYTRMRRLKAFSQEVKQLNIKKL